MIPLLLTALLFQTPQPTVPPIDSFVFVGLTGQPSTAPHPSALGALVIPAPGLPASAQTWSWTMQQFLFSKAAVTNKLVITTDTSTGAAKDMYQIPINRHTKAHLILLGTLGAATSTTGSGVTTGLSTNVGGGIAFTGFSRKFAWFVPFVGVIQTHTGTTTQLNPVIAIGRTLGK